MVKRLKLKRHSQPGYKLVVHKRWRLNKLYFFIERYLTDRQSNNDYN